MKLSLIVPANSESLWTFDRILASLGQRRVFPNLASPTRRASRRHTTGWRAVQRAAWTALNDPRMREG